MELLPGQSGERTPTTQFRWTCVSLLLKDLTDSDPEPSTIERLGSGPGSDAFKWESSVGEPASPPTKPALPCPALPCFCCLISLSYLNLLASITSNCRPFPLLTCSGAHSGFLLHLVVSFGWCGHNTCRRFTVWFGRGRSSHLLPSHQHLRSGSSQPVPQGRAWWPLFGVHAFWNRLRT